MKEVRGRARGDKIMQDEPRNTVSEADTSSSALEAGARHSCRRRTMGHIDLSRDKIKYLAT